MKPMLLRDHVLLSPFDTAILKPNFNLKEKNISVETPKQFKDI
jgi:hypothetical protein